MRGSQLEGVGTWLSNRPVCLFSLLGCSPAPCRALEEAWKAPALPQERADYAEGEAATQAATVPPLVRVDTLRWSSL